MKLVNFPARNTLDDTGKPGKSHPNRCRCRWDFRHDFLSGNRPLHGGLHSSLPGLCVPQLENMTRHCWDLHWKTIGKPTGIWWLNGIEWCLTLW